VKLGRAPRSKKRVSCDLTIEGDRYKGIVLDLSATGLFVQTNVKPASGVPVIVALRLPGVEAQVIFDARVARKKAVPAALLTAAGGGIGLAIEKAPKAYFDFIAQVSPIQAQFVADSNGLDRCAASESSRGAAAGPAGDAAGNRPAAGTMFRIHVVETATGRKNSYLVNGESEDAASTQVLDQLGAEWQVLFVERA
jgi:hypothetical protein